MVDRPSIPPRRVNLERLVSLEVLPGTFQQGDPYGTVDLTVGQPTARGDDISHRVRFIDDDIVNDR